MSDMRLSRAGDIEASHTWSADLDRDERRLFVDEIKQAERDAETAYSYGDLMRSIERRRELLERREEIERQRRDLTKALRHHCLFDTAQFYARLPFTEVAKST